ncbi:alginate O-acetyltransferase AlgX-related protein [uncultured Helcococcus sp.]|uniref:alginate O-acetyltransferase AlgX-related protein n=1 Tax=uncultured Helcococcus sp. TaxID=1072508 RepID=UPI00288B567A|nr:hypothetical protein [uncultured Helcococcus sp.]
MKRINYLKVYGFVFFLILISALTIYKMTGEASFLENENRYKTKLIKPDKENLLNGEFITNLEESINDNLILRSKILSAQNYLDINVLNKYKVSDVIFSQDKTKLFRFREDKGQVDEEQLNEDLENWEKINNNFKKSDVKLIVVGFPDQSHIFTDQYPYFAFNNEEKYQESKKLFFNGLEKIGIENIDMDAYLRKDREQFYTKTDHHPNFYAAMEAYKLVFDKLSNDGLKLDDVINKSDLLYGDYNFVGAHTRKVFNYIKEDFKMPYLEAKTPISYTRQDKEDFGKEIFKNTQYYASYMGGDSEFTLIDTDREDLPNIMVIGDSTSNMLESIFWMNANKFISLDFRKIKDRTIADYVEEYKPDIVIVSIISGYYDDLNKIMK